MATDVAHDGIPSVIHIMVAKQKTAMTRCSITVRLSIPNTLEGRFQTTNPTITPTMDMVLYAVWGVSANTNLYDAVASLTRGLQTNDNNAVTGIQTSPTKANSGVYTYNASVFGASSDAANTNTIYYYRGILDATTGSYGSDGDTMDYPNYVKIGITCWRIVCTTGSGGVKLIYGNAVFAG